MYYYYYYILFIIVTIHYNINPHLLVGPDEGGRAQLPRGVHLEEAPGAAQDAECPVGDHDVLLGHPQGRLEALGRALAPDYYDYYYYYYYYYYNYNYNYYFYYYY